MGAPIGAPMDAGGWPPGASTAPVSPYAASSPGRRLPTVNRAVLVTGAVAAAAAVFVVGVFMALGGGGTSGKLSSIVKDTLTSELATKGVAVSVSEITCGEFAGEPGEQVECTATIDGASGPVMIDATIVSNVDDRLSVSGKMRYPLLVSATLPTELLSVAGVEVSSCSTSAEYMVLSPGTTFSCTRSDGGVLAFSVAADGQVRAEVQG